MRSIHSPAIVHAAAWDAGNRYARNNGRVVWNADDYAAACEEYEHLWPSPESEEPDGDQRNLRIP